MSRVRVNELRGWLATRLKQDDVPPPLWGWLEDDGLVDGALDPGCPVSDEDLLVAARDRLRLVGELTPFVDETNSTARSVRGRYSGNERGDAASAETRESTVRLFEQYLGDQLLTPEERERYGIVDDPLLKRALAFSLYLAKLADEVPEVRGIRREVWDGGKPLSVSEADDLIRSPAAAVLSFDSFRFHGIPIGGHRSEVCSQVVERDTLRRWASGVVVVGERDPERKSSTPTRRIPFEGRALTSNPTDPGRVASVLSGDETDSLQPVRVLQGSVTAALLDVADDLERRFPWKSPGGTSRSTLRYILTGEPPLVEPMRVEVPSDTYEAPTPMSISVWPWVSTAELASRFGRVRKELDPTPTTTNRRLALLTFILGRPDVRVLAEGAMPETPPWRELFDVWNERYPEGHDWHYTDVRNFNRDVRHAYNQTVHYYRSGEESGGRHGG